MIPIRGKRYWFTIDNYHYPKREKSGLFTGEYCTDGCVILVTKSGERWRIPVENLYEKENVK